MPKPDLVNAKWVAGFPAELPDKTPLIPGETIVAIPRGEAEESENWEVQGGKVAKAEAEKAGERS